MGTYPYIWVPTKASSIARRMAVLNDTDAVCAIRPDQRSADGLPKMREGVHFGMRLSRILAVAKPAMPLQERLHVTFKERRVRSVKRARDKRREKRAERFEVQRRDNQRPAS